jgi:hypothetical protein
MAETTRHRAHIRRSPARPVNRRHIAPLALLALASLVSACSSSPVTVTRVDARDVHRRLTRSALSQGQLSPYTRNVLLEADLSALYENDPELALERLHDLAISGSGGPNELFAAAEASFLHAERTGQLPYYLVSTLYAWAYLFPEDPLEVPSPFDPRFRLAADIYNRGLTSALETAEGRNLALHGGAFDVPFGRQLHVAFDPEQLHWRGRRMTSSTTLPSNTARHRSPRMAPPVRIVYRTSFSARTPIRRIFVPRGFALASKKGAKSSAAAP